MIKCSHLSKSLGQKEIFTDLSFEIKAGEFVAITGPSGCGKTTLLNILGFIEGGYEGDYAFDGQSGITVNTYRAQKVIRDRISYLFQNFALIEEETVCYNLLLALKYVKRKKAEKLLLIKEVLASFDLEHSLQQKVAELSGGEQQRVALARVILKPSDVILADEPTGSLDATNRDKVLAVLEDLNQAGKTVVVVTHDTIVASRCHRSIHLG